MVDAYYPEQHPTDWGSQGAKLMKDLTLIEVENQRQTHDNFREDRQHHAGDGNYYPDYGSGFDHGSQHKNQDYYYQYGRENGYNSQGYSPRSTIDYDNDGRYVIRSNGIDDSYDYVGHSGDRVYAPPQQHDIGQPQYFDSKSPVYNASQTNWQLTSVPKVSPTDSQDSGHVSPKASEAFSHNNYGSSSSKYGTSVGSPTTNPGGHDRSPGRAPQNLTAQSGRLDDRNGQNMAQDERFVARRYQEHPYNSNNVNSNPAMSGKLAENRDLVGSRNKTPSPRNGSNYDRNAELVSHHSDSGTSNTTSINAAYTQGNITAHRSPSKSPQHRGIDRRPTPNVPIRSVRDTVKGYDYGEPRRPSSRSSNDRSSITSLSSVESGSSQNRNGEKKKQDPGLRLLVSGEGSHSHHKGKGQNLPHRPHATDQNYAAQMKQRHPQIGAPTAARVERFQSPGKFSSPVKSREMVQRKPGGAVVKNPLLKYDVVPPKKQGPSDAERKLEELTRQLELEMEENPDGEEFGECCIYISVVYVGVQIFVHISLAFFTLH